MIMKTIILEDNNIILKPYSTNDMDYVINLHNKKANSVFDDIDKPNSTISMKDKINLSLNTDTLGWICWLKEPQLRFGIVYFSNIIPNINALFHPISDMQGYKKYILSKSAMSIRLMDVASRLALKFALDSLQLQRISGVYFVKNLPIINLCNRLGFKTEGILRNGTRLNNIPQDTIMMSLLPGELD